MIIVNNMDMHVGVCVCDDTLLMSIILENLSPSVRLFFY